jgi:arabinogalactan endo-1,4-beta-galactosidase
MFAPPTESLQLHAKARGFNLVRLRTFVDSKTANVRRDQWLRRLTRTVDFGERINDACMRLLVDFHCSDNWADPGKQCVPIAWQGYTTVLCKDRVTRRIASRNMSRITGDRPRSQSTNDSSPARHDRDTR